MTLSHCEKRPLKRDPPLYLFFIFLLFCTLLLSSFWTSRGHRCRPFSPPVLAFNFYRAKGSAIPLLVDFSSNVANSRSRAFRKSICAKEKLPTNLYEYALEGIRTHETETYTRLEDNLIRHRGDRTNGSLGPLFRTAKRPRAQVPSHVSSKTRVQF